MTQGLPIPSDTVRQTWGAGVRAGMYPISDTELYWFTVFNAPEVSQRMTCVATYDSIPPEGQASALRMC